MSLNEVEGQARAIEALQKALAAQRVHHAWLFHGPEGVGKELAAVAFAQALTCRVAPYVGCGTCASCTQGAQAQPPRRHLGDARGRAGAPRRWPAAATSTRTPSRDIRIEQVRKLQERLSFRPLEAPHKVVLIITAHAMNTAAQNALLKTLEEPPARHRAGAGDVVGADKLLPTIRSRCTKAAFGAAARVRWSQKR